jgi:hypothetical protein
MEKGDRRREIRVFISAKFLTDSLIVKKIIFLLMAILAAGVTNAQPGVTEYGFAPVDDDLKLLEFEMGTGINFARGLGEMKARPGGNMMFELRLNRPEPWDVGLQLGGAKFRSVAAGLPDVRTTIFSPSVFVDWNLRLNRRTALFAGMGLGGDFAESRSVVHIAPRTGFLFSGNSTSFALTPRVGVSVLGFLRFTASYTYPVSKIDCSRFSMSVGITIGGSYRSRIPDRRSRKQKFLEDVAPAIIESFIW